MKYHDPQPISRTEAEAALKSGDADTICDTLVRLAYHDPDWQWVQNRCLNFIKHPNADVRGLAATCLGHLARIHGELDLAIVKPTLLALKNDPEVSGYAESALDDIQMYLENGKSQTSE